MDENVSKNFVKFEKSSTTVCKVRHNAIKHASKIKFDVLLFCYQINKSQFCFTAEIHTFV